jgi:hypothetical protein
VAPRWFLTLALCALACGGTTRRNGSELEPTGKSCELNGKTYVSGSKVEEAGCTCTCHDGEIGCTQLPCPTTCTYAGVGYQAGQSFPAEDGCNSCSCEADGSVSCTEIGCQVSCTELNQLYMDQLVTARACTPDGLDTCSDTRPASLPCNCPSHVNPSAREALANAQAFADEYAARDCNAGITCNPCPPLAPATCSPEGLCAEAPPRQ